MGTVFNVEYTGGNGRRYTITATTWEEALRVRDDILDMYNSFPGMGAHGDGVVIRVDCFMCTGRAELYGAGPCATHTEDVWVGAR